MARIKKKFDLNQKNVAKKSRIRRVKKNHAAESDSENVSHETLENAELDNPALSPADEGLFDDSLDENFNPLNDSLESNGESLANLTLPELAQLAKPFSNRSLSTLQRLKREELYYIIHNQKDDYEKTELSNLNRDSKDFIEVIINILQDIKESRGGGNLNALLVRIFRNQGNRLAEGFVKLGISGGVFGWIMCGGVITLLIIDSVWGLSHIAKMFKKEQKTDNVKTQSN
jgi:hypothetical protein